MDNPTESVLRDRLLERGDEPVATDSGLRLAVCELLEGRADPVASELSRELVDSADGADVLLALWGRQ